MKTVSLISPFELDVHHRLIEQLEAEGFQVLHAPLKADNGGCLSLLNDRLPDAILLPVWETHYLPQYQWCQEAKQEPTMALIPILLLGEDEPNSEQGHRVNHVLLEGLHIGAHDYVRSPYPIAELVGKLNAAIRIKSLMEKNQMLVQQMNHLNDELTHRNVQVEKDLYITRQLQQSLLPPAIISPNEEDENAPLVTRVHFQNEKLRISGVYLPCDALGGDLYDIMKFQDNSIGVAITDVSGHGVPAGFITAIFKTSLFRTALDLGQPSHVLAHLNNELYEIVKTGDYVTAVYLRIYMDTMYLECSGAGHPYPYYYQAETDSMIRLKENGTPLVWVPNMDYPQDTVQLKPGDKVFLFTDGVSELKNPNKDLFSEEQIEAVLLDAIRTHTPYPMDNLIEALSDFTEGAPLDDDLSMVFIEAL